MDIPDYCRQIEAYLCQKNDGHLIRVVGPSFELVSRWAAEGVPLKVAFRGIDQYFERYYRKGSRRRPVRVDFCEADVFELFDHWRRAVGLTRAGADELGAACPSSEGAQEKRSGSLPAHLARALIRLTDARATGTLGPEADEAIDRVAGELDRARASANGLRGDARRGLIGRLEELDAELLRIARACLDERQLDALEREADEDLAIFRHSMPRDAYLRAQQAAIDNLTRARLRLPTLTFR